MPKQERIKTKSRGVYYIKANTACQSALKIDPPSASNFDPPPVKKFSVFVLS